jgi:flagellar biosynthesis protein FlhB
MKNLSPKKGLEKLKPKPASWELFRSVIKLAAVAAVVYPTISAWRDHLANDRTLAGAIERLSGAYGGVIVRAALLALIIAAADFAYQKKTNDTKMKMSMQDIKREFRDSEGDPYQKAARKRRASEMSRNRMMSDVATADVLVTNPTHLVVALRYDPAEGAPRVIAKGADEIADRLKAIARRNGVPITPDLPLARALYRQCKVGQHVPAALYEAVAVVLAMAYRRTGRSPGSRLSTRATAGVA